MPLSDRERRLLEACQQALDYFERPNYGSSHARVTIPRQLEAALDAYSTDELPLPGLRERLEAERRAELEARR